MSSSDTPTPDEFRVDFVDSLLERSRGIEAVALWLDGHPEFPTPQSQWMNAAKDLELSIGAWWGDNQADTLAAWARMLADGAPIGAVAKVADGDYMVVRRDFGGRVFLRVSAHRSEVCEMVKVGTETVEVPDPDAPPTPMVTVERDVTEWRCSPILDARSPSGAAAGDPTPDAKNAAVKP